MAALHSLFFAARVFKEKSITTLRAEAFSVLEYRTLLQVAEH